MILPGEFRKSVIIKVIAEPSMKEGEKVWLAERQHPCGESCRLIYVSRASKHSKEHSQIHCAGKQRTKKHTKISHDQKEKNHELHRRFNKWWVYTQHP